MAEFAAAAAPVLLAVFDGPLLRRQAEAVERLAADLAEYHLRGAGQTTPAFSDMNITVGSAESFFPKGSQTLSLSPGLGPWKEQMLPRGDLCWHTAGRWAEGWWGQT